jgi:hypothetical protein
MPRSKASRLNNARKGGATLKGPNGQVVTHDPRHGRDDKPWVDSMGNRFGSNVVKPTVD